MENQEAVELLKKLIATPSFSKEESGTAKILKTFFSSKNISVNIKGNNVWVKNFYFDDSKPTILLNSHHDTVKPNPGYTKDPFNPEIENGKLYGLGSNDAGASLVALLFTFLSYYDKKDLKYNFIFAGSAEEEISGNGGVESILNELGAIDFGIVGEPTQMHLAIAEKGLLVIDCIAKGKSGHAAREEGENAIYKAMEDIAWIKNYRFPKVSELLGPVKMSVTIIQSGSQHNVVPDQCKFTVDIRLNECYTMDEVINFISSNIKSQVIPRSTRLKPSSISIHHPVVQAGISLGRKTYGSPTTSDQALMNFPTLKLGPGDSARSHTADEFIYIKELEEGINLYKSILNKIVFK